MRPRCSRKRPAHYDSDALTWIYRRAHGCTKHTFFFFFFFTLGLSGVFWRVGQPMKTLVVDRTTLVPNLTRGKSGKNEKRNIKGWCSTEYRFLMMHFLSFFFFFNFEGSSFSFLFSCWLVAMPVVIWCWLVSSPGGQYRLLILPMGSGEKKKS